MRITRADFVAAMAKCHFVNDCTDFDALWRDFESRCRVCNWLLPKCMCVVGGSPYGDLWNGDEARDQGKD